MAILGKINPEHVDLKEMIMSSKVLDEMQKTQILILATKVSQEERVNLLDALKAEQQQLNTLKQNYRRIIERFENSVAEVDADAREQAEADKILARLNNL